MKALCGYEHEAFYQFFAFINTAYSQNRQSTWDNCSFLLVISQLKRMRCQNCQQLPTEAVHKILGSIEKHTNFWALQKKNIATCILPSSTQAIAHVCQSSFCGFGCNYKITTVLSYSITHDQITTNYAYKIILWGLYFKQSKIYFQTDKQEKILKLLDFTIL